MRPQQHSMYSTRQEYGQTPESKIGRSHGLHGRFIFVLLTLLGPIVGLSCSSLAQREAPSEFGWEEQRLKANIGANFEKAAALRDLGIIYLRTGRFADATMSLRQSTDEERSDAKTWFYAGLAYEFQGTPQQALQIYKESPLRSGGTVYSQATNGRIALLERAAEHASLRSMYERGKLPPTDSLIEGTIAVFPIDCQSESPEETVLGLGLSDLINFHINELQGLSAIDADRSEVAFRLASEASTDQVLTDPEVAARALRAGTMLGGTCVVDKNGQVQVDLVMRDLKNGDDLFVSAQNSAENILTLENTLVDSLVFKIGVFAPNRNRNITTIPGGYNALLAYSKAIEAEREGSFGDAMAFLKRSQVYNPRLIISEARMEKLDNFILARGETQKDLLGLLIRLESKAVLPHLMDDRMSGYAWGIGFGIIPGQGTRRLPPGNAGELPSPPTPVRN